MYYDGYFDAEKEYLETLRDRSKQNFWGWIKYHFFGFPVGVLMLIWIWAAMIYLPIKKILIPMIKGKKIQDDHVVPYTVVNCDPENISEYIKQPALAQALINFFVPLCQEVSILNCKERGEIDICGRSRVDSLKRVWVMIEPHKDGAGQLTHIITLKVCTDRQLALIILTLDLYRAPQSTLIQAAHEMGQLVLRYSKNRSAQDNSEEADIARQFIEKLDIKDRRDSVVQPLMDFNGPIEYQ